MLSLDNYRKLMWPTIFDDDFFRSEKLKTNSLSMQAQENGDEVVYTIKLPVGFDKKSIDATIEGDVLKVVIPKIKPKEMVPENKVEIKGV